MIWGENRQAYRQFFFDAWKKFKNKEALTDLEQQLALLIQQHPEYISYFENAEKYKDQDFFPELGQTNPFLHLSLHLSILDQLKLDRPAGIRELYQKLINKFHGDIHLAEHHMMEKLIQELYQAQSENREFCSEAYLNILAELLK